MVPAPPRCANKINHLACRFLRKQTVRLSLGSEKFKCKRNFDVNRREIAEKEQRSVRFRSSKYHSQIRNVPFQDLIIVSVW